MIITHKLEMDLARRKRPERADMVQGDRNSRPGRVSQSL